MIYEQTVDNSVSSLA